MRNRRLVVQGIVVASFLTGAVAGLLAVPAGDRTVQASPLGNQTTVGQAPAQATPSGRLSSCQGVVTQTISAGAVRWCEDAEVVARVAPICSVCPGGVNVLFVIMRLAHEPGWQRAESIRTLEVLQRWEDDPDLDATFRVGVVRYDYRGGNSVVQMTENLNSARGALGGGISIVGCPMVACECWPFLGQMQGAVADGLDMIRRAHEASGLGDDDKTCDFVVLFNEGTYGQCSGFEMQENALRAIRAAQGMERDVGPLLVGCPSTVDANCESARQIPRNRTYYAQANRLGVLPDILDRELERLASPHLMRRLTLTEKVPNGLAYVPGSASEPPTDVITTTDGVELVWKWEQLEAEVPHEVRFRVGPSRSTLRRARSR